MVFLDICRAVWQSVVGYIPPEPVVKFVSFGTSVCPLPKVLRTHSQKHCMALKGGYQQRILLFIRVALSFGKGVNL